MSEVSDVTREEARGVREPGEGNGHNQEIEKENYDVMAVHFPLVPPVSSSSFLGSLRSLRGERRKE